MAGVISPNHSTELNFKIYAPRLELRPWVQCFWSIGSDAHCVRLCDEKLYPDGGASLIISFAATGPQVEIWQNRSTQIRKFSSDVPQISVRFRPGAVFLLLGVAPQDIDENPMVVGQDLHCSWSSSLIGMTERSVGLPASSQISNLEAWLCSRLKVLSSQENVVFKIASEIEKTLCKAAELECYSGMSRRSTERKLKRELGVSPGQLLTFFRLRTARQLLSTPSVPLAEVALHCGYYDQAHFSHAFFEFTQESPLAYRKRKLSQIYKAAP